MVNAVPPGGKAIVLNAGYFAARWANICKAFGINAVVARDRVGPAGRPRSGRRGAAAAPRHGRVLGTLSETSTGTGHPVEAIGRIVAETPAVFAVDGISGVGAMECRTDAWGIDLLCVGSQKALMLPPGLAFVAVSPKAWAKIDAFDSHSYYFNLKAARKKIKEFDTPYTPAHTLILALRTALRRIKDEGLENVWQRHRKMSEACQAGIQALGLELFSARPAEGLTAFRVPDGLKDSQIRNKLDRAVRHHDRRRPGQAQGQDHPDRPHGLHRRARRDQHAGGPGDDARRAGLRRRARPGHHRRAAGLDRPEERGRGRLSDEGELNGRITVRFGRRSIGPSAEFSDSAPPLVGARVRVRESRMATHRVLVTDKLAEEGLAQLRGRAGDRGRGRHQAGQGPAGSAPGADGGRRDRDPVGHAADGRGARGPVAAQGDRPRGRRASTTSTSPAATRRGIVVMNTPGGNTVSTAEHTMALMLVAGAQRRPRPTTASRRASGTGTSSPARSSRARRWASIGLGRVGLAVAKRAQGFGMTVVGFDPFLAAEKALELRRRERGAARRPLGPLRLHHAAHADDGRDAQPDRRRARSP